MRTLRLAPLVFAIALAAPLTQAQAPASTPTPSGAFAAALDAVRTTDYPRAERQLAAIRGAEQPAAQVALARVMLEQGRYAEADRLAVLASASPSQKVAAIAVRAEALAAVGKTADAIKLLEPVKDAPDASGRMVRLLLGEYRIAIGHRKDADDPLMKVVEEYNNGSIVNTDAEGLAQVGRAAYLLRSPKDANQAFNESERVDKHNVHTLLWRAELFLDKYDPGHAEEVLHDLLQIGPKGAAALVLMARVKLEQTLDFDAADQLVRDALAVNPKLPGVYAVRAGLALRDMDLAAAEGAIAQGLAIDPNDLELWSLRAADKFLGDDHAGYEQAKRETLARNAEYARFYEIVGDYAEWEHRYDDIATMMREAVQLDPDDGKAWAELGLTLQRSGDETAGLDALRKAWSKDHFNVRVFNTLNLYEQTIATQYETGTANVFKVRYPKDEKAVLERYVPKMLGEAWGSMKARYSFVPTTPVQVELYATREQFSVRTSGLPNIGIQGVCFGHVLAAMSPKSEPFNWGNVVWHELGHVFAIQLSKNHVPRWFTEGLSEYETIARRPEWQRELDPELYLAIMAGRLPSAVDMNRAFTHATDGNDVTVAYYAASQMLVFTVEQFGMPRVVEALKLWGEGVRTPDVIQRAFGVSAPEYDSRYRAWETSKLRRYKGQFLFDDHPKPLDGAKAASDVAPQDAGLRAGLALALLHAHKGDEAKQQIAEALRLDPNLASAHFMAFKMAEHDHDGAAAAAHLAAIQRAGGDGFQVQMGLAELAEGKHDKAAMRAALEAAARFDPTQSEPLRGLFDMANEEKRDADALDALRKLAVLEQHDRRIWRTLLARLVDQKKWDEARQVGESAIYVDVENAPLHTNYARALAAGGQHDKAIFEIESSLLCNAPPKDLAAAHAALAAERLALHHPAEAKKERDEALRLDPENAEAKGLRIP
jgi:tetratricopeptide (TPR) repeat protein